jgi:hypothetical protein
VLLAGDERKQSVARIDVTLPDADSTGKPGPASCVNSGVLQRCWLLVDA